jgi:hypothetical protein
LSFLETSHVAEGPFGSSDPLAGLIEYFRTNGYEVVDSTTGPRPAILTWKAELEGDEPEHGASATADATAIQPKEVSDDNLPTEEAAAGAAAAAAPEPAEPTDAPEALETKPETPNASNDAETADSDPEDGDDSAANPNDVDESATDDEIVLRAQLRRGKQGASIWSSNMADLLSEVDVKVIGNSIRIAYKIETTFQHFNDDDNAFWAHEAKQAIRMATGGKAIDWRDNEEIRVSRQQKDIIMIGFQLAVLAAILVAIAYFAFNRA